MLRLEMLIDGQSQDRRISERKRQMALPLSSPGITKTIYRLANTVSVSLILLQCAGRQMPNIHARIHV